MARLLLLFFLFIATIGTNGQTNTSVSLPDVWLKPEVELSESEDFDKRGLINFNPAWDIENEAVRFMIDHSISQFGGVTVICVSQARSQVSDKEYGICQFGEIGLTSQRAYNSDLIMPYSAKTSSKPIIHTLALSNAKSRTGPLTLGRTVEREIPFSGWIAEFLLFDRVLSDEERSHLETALAIKYGVHLWSDYKISNDRILWNQEENEEFENRISGIGRWEALDVNQKQSHSADGPFVLTMGVGLIAASNAENSNSIQDGDFLLWGDNGESLSFRSNNSVSNSSFTPIERIWRIQASGENPSQIPVQVRINTKELLGNNSEEECWLLIDRTGQGNFSSPQVECIALDNINGNIAAFSSIFWDIDGSGADAFTFALRSGTNSSKEDNFNVFPSPSPGAFYIQANVQELEDVSINIFSSEGKLVKKLPAMHSNKIEEHIGKAGLYFVKFELNQNETYTRRLTIQ